MAAMHTQLTLTYISFVPMELFIVGDGGNCGNVRTIVDWRFATCVEICDVSHFGHRFVNILALH